MGDVLVRIKLQFETFEVGDSYGGNEITAIVLGESGWFHVYSDDEVICKVNKDWVTLCETERPSS